MKFLSVLFSMDEEFRGDKRSKTNLNWRAMKYVSCDEPQPLKSIDSGTGGKRK